MFTASDTNLIRYLFRHKHTSPFESISFQFVLKIPIYIARQIIRHRTAKVNEVSQRYTTVDTDFHHVKPRMQGNQHNKQSSDIMVPTDDINESWNHYTNAMSESFAMYQELTNNGVAREVARAGLPLATFTTLYWQMDLHNLLKFLELRMAEGAQLEIQELANAIAELIEPFVPIVMNIFHITREGIFLNRNDLQVLDINMLEKEYKGTRSELIELRMKLDYSKKINNETKKETNGI
jgi:thymidylate synthase (FAD)